MNASTRFQLTSVVDNNESEWNYFSDYVEITGEVEGEAPVPVLGVNVRQGGAVIDDQLNVKPGTPLNMEVYLDDISADVYGLMVTGMEVTDTGNQVEPILVNGYKIFLLF